MRLPCKDGGNTVGLQQESAQYRGYRTAGIRLTEELESSAIVAGDAEPAEYRAATHLFDKAHVLMLAERGLIPVEAARTVLAALREMDRDGLEDGDRHAGENQLIRRFGEEVAGHINLGRSTGDLGAVARRMTHVDNAIELADALVRFREVLAGLVPHFTESLVPGFTHGQVAQPSSFAHWLCMWLSVFARDAERLLAVLARLGHSPAGAGIMAGSDFDVSRERTAELLGFDAVLENSWDAVHSHDTDVIEIAAVVAIIGANLGRFSDDLQVWFGPQFEIVDFPDRYCGTSSIMPQKRNPEFLEANRACAAESSLALNAALYSERGSTGASFKERKVTDLAVVRATRRVSDQLRASALVMTAVSVDDQRSIDVLEATWSTAADLASLLVRRCALPWRSAHQIAGIVVRLMSQRGADASELTSETLDEAAVLYFDRKLELPTHFIRDALDPRQSMKRRRIRGGSAPDEVMRQHAVHVPGITKDRDSVQAWRSTIVIARAGLDAEIALFLSASEGDS